MKVWTKETARDEIVKLGNQINALANGQPFSSDHTRWMANVLRVLEEVFGMNSRYYAIFSQLNWTFQGSTMVMTYELLNAHPDDVMRQRDQGAYRRTLDTAHGLLRGALDELQAAPDVASVYEGKDTAPEASSILKVINIVERKFRKVIHDKPDRETQLQDLFESLLVGADVPYTREKMTFEYSSRAYRPDFVLEEIDLVIELKICDSEKRERDIVKEMNDDTLAYKTKFGNILS